MLSLIAAAEFESPSEVQVLVLSNGMLRMVALAVLLALPTYALAGSSGPSQRLAVPPVGASNHPDTAANSSEPATSTATAGSNEVKSGKPTAEHIAKARQLILATGISRSFQIIIPEFMDQIGNTLTQARPDLVHDMHVVLDQLRPEFDKQSDEMIDRSAQIYATLLSEKEIDEVLAFFNSDAGKRYVGAQPLFLNQLVSGMQAWQQKIAINMMARVRQEMKKKGHDL